MKVYTKTGDKGQTSLASGERVSKCCQRLESYGTVDELNSFIGVLITSVNDKADKQFLADVQNKLFVVGSCLATAKHETSPETPDDVQEVHTGNEITEEMVEAVEAEIDRLQEMLPPLKCFILPGGTHDAAYAHVCRTVTRRTERHMLRLMEEGAEVDATLIAYINRLSDYFFVLARKLNADASVPDVTWDKN